jgi:hypothetical protein
MPGMACGNNHHSRAAMGKEMAGTFFGNNRHSRAAEGTAGSAFSCGNNRRGNTWEPAHNRGTMCPPAVTSRKRVPGHGLARRERLPAPEKTGVISCIHFLATWLGEPSGVSRRVKEMRFNPFFTRQR